jgi:hypothetical protein
MMGKKGQPNPTNRGYLEIPQRISTSTELLFLKL